MSAFLEFHLQSGADDGFNVTVFERNSSQPLAASRFEYRLDGLAQFEISRLDSTLATHLAASDDCRTSGASSIKDSSPAKSNDSGGSIGTAAIY